MTIENSALDRKTRELCQAILIHPDYLRIRQRIDTFKNHPEAMALYQTVCDKSETLQQKQGQGFELTDDEMADFEKTKQAFLDHPVAGDFIEAQQEIHSLKKTITQHVSLTMELGRLPTADELQPNSCGSGCGCH